MSEKQWVIVGLDPGTTIGYSILDLNGKLIKVDSSKEFNLSSIISKVIEYGRVLAVGTDKQRVPGLIHDFAAKTGAKIISPEQDLTTCIKDDLTKEYEFKGDHQKDALASAALAYKRISHLINKINEFLEKVKKQNLNNRIIELVIKNEGISIRTALNIIEKPNEITKIIKRVTETKEINKKDFFRLNEEIRKINSENKLLRMQNSNLRNEIQDMQKVINKQPIDKPNLDKKISEVIKQKDQRINFLDYSIRNKDKNIKNLKEDINKLNKFLAYINKTILLKKIENLGSNEFENKKQILNIKEGDVLLVNNPNIISQNVYEKIKEKISIIVCKEEPSKKVKESFNFIFLDYNNLKIEETIYFAIVDKQDFEKQIEKEDLFKKIIREYKSSQV